MRPTLYLLLFAVAGLTGCSTPLGRIVVDAIGVGGGAALGHTLSHGNLAATAGGAVGGLIAGEGLNYFQKKAETNAWHDGFVFGQAQAVKDQYWSNRQSHLPGPAAPLLYPIQVPEQETRDGVVLQPSTQYLRIHQ